MAKLKQFITKLTTRLMVHYGYLSPCCHKKVVEDLYHRACCSGCGRKL